MSIFLDLLNDGAFAASQEGRTVGKIVLTVS